MEKERIAIGSDHGGFTLKQHVMKHLEERGIEYKDFGTYDTNSCHYPVYAKAVAKAVVSGEYDRGILICGTGIGISIAANKVKGIRASLCSDTYSARLTRNHNNSNILCMGERVLGVGLALDIVDSWLDAEYEGGRHQTRIDMLEED